MRTDGNVAKEGGEGVSDRAYLEWIADLKRRYRRTQIKAAVAVNSAMLEFYWSLGKDISGKYPGKKRNSGFYAGLSTDLCLGIPDPKGLSPTNIKYARYFHELYSYRQQLADDNESSLKVPQVVEDVGSTDYRQQLADDNVVSDLMKVPWGHHILIIGKSKGDRDKALYLCPQDDRERLEPHRSSGGHRRQALREDWQGAHELLRHVASSRRISREGTYQERILIRAYWNSGLKQRARS